MRWSRLALVLVVAGGIALRLVWTGPLWLDEALSAQIARRPIGPMFSALKHDGSPPLYYLLLHGWIALFGASTLAVRAMSSVLAVVALPLAWWAGSVVGGRRLAPWALLAVAVAPWTLRYATETRMYGLLFDLVLLGVAVLVRAVRSPSNGRLVAVTLTTLAIAYTHYWGFYVLGPVAVWLLVRRHRRVLTAMALAVVGFAPWLPSFVFQLRHTGTPWATPASLSLFPDTVTTWGGPGFGGTTAVAVAVGLGLLALAVVGSHRRLWAAVVAPLLLAVVLGLAAGQGYAIRYTAVVLPAYLLLVARGLLRLPSAVRVAVAAALVAGGLYAGTIDVRTPRTQGGEVATAITAGYRPGDVVAYCPDQLSPAVARLLPPTTVQVAYADPSGPSLVDWADYSSRVRSLAPQTFSSDLLARAGSHRIWLVEQDGYRVYAGVCPAVVAALTAARGAPVTPVRADDVVLEHESLQVYG